MNESPLHIDRSCIFRETFENGIQGVADNRYAKGTISSNGVKIYNNKVNIRGVSSSGTISYSKIYIPTKSTFSIKISKIYKVYYGLAYVSQFIGKGSKYLLSISDNGSGGYNFYFEGGTILPFIEGDVLTVVQRSYSIWPFGDVYVNGIKKASNVKIGTAYSLQGYYSFGFNTGATYKGDFDCEFIQLYNRDLSDSEVKLLYQSQLYTFKPSLPLLLDFDSTGGQLIDRTGRNTLTASNVEIKSVGKVKSAYFNGVNSNILINNFKLNLSNPFIISGWVYSNLLNNYPAILSNYNGATPNVLMLYLIKNYKMVFTNLYNNAGSHVANGFPSSNSEVYKKLTHFSVAYNSSYMRVYGNGKQMDGNTPYISGTSLSGILSSKLKYYIGCDNGNSNFFKGYLPKLQLFNSGVISDNATDFFISQLYNSQKWMFS